MNLIFNALYKGLTMRPNWRLDDMLWVSDLGRQPYGIARRLLLKELTEFDFATLMAMSGGTALEKQTERDIRGYTEKPYITQLPLYNEHWSGRADFVFGHGTDKVIIVDHKGTAGKWWDYKDSLPRLADCCEIWQYGQLYEEMFGIKPRLALFYRGWKSWAEYEIRYDRCGNIGMAIYAEGKITDEKGNIKETGIRMRDIDPQLLAVELMSLQDSIRAGLFKKSDLEAMESEINWNYAEEATRRIRRELRQDERDNRP